MPSKTKKKTEHPNGKAAGGRARAEALTAERRSEIARKAAATRWDGREALPRASHYGELEIGGITVPCAVLTDGTRVLTQWGFYRAIGRSGRPAGGRGSDVEKMAPFLALDNIKPYVSSELAASTRPIVFLLPSGNKAYGYRADLLPQVCDVYLRARENGDLLKSQLKFAQACELLTRGLAHVGIVALVDEATGYQADRARDALAKILERFIAKELRPWLHTFSDEFYGNLFRLRGLEFPRDTIKRPQYFGHLTNDIVYKRLAPGVLAELKKAAARDATGKATKPHLHRRLSENVGHPKLREHLASVVALMKISDDYEGFIQHLDKALPRYGEPLRFDFGGDGI